ncbi:MAG: DUF1659 domain-containing protein [Dialister sp.]|nr:DUF1659 domain-containing protein [Dialister sp.]
MAIKKVIDKTKLVLSVETGESNEKGPILRSVTTTRIKTGASDEVLFSAGTAIGSLLAHDLAALHRVDTATLERED